MASAESNLKSPPPPIRWPYYGWFLLSMPVLFCAGISVAIFLSTSADSESTNRTVLTTEPVKPHPVDVNGQAYARYAVAGQKNERKGGWGPSDNFPRWVAEADTFGEPEKLSIVVTTTETARVGEFSGLHLRIVNRSGERMYFSAVDSHLYLVQEAKNDTGEWQAVERLPRGTGPADCVVGLHRVSLKPGQYWDLVAPCYGGPFPTKLRFRLDLGKADGRFPEPGGAIIYSSEFEGSVNARQFQQPDAE